MKNSNFAVLTLLILFMVSVLLAGFVHKDTASSSVSSSPEIHSEQSSLHSLPTDSVPDGKTEEIFSVSNTSTEPSALAEPADLSQALFIGDSRTVGLSDYSGLSSDFYANVGMTVFNIQNGPIPVPHVGKVTLEELLKNKHYDKIYLMLGINELGYPFDSLITQYGKTVDFIKGLQPDASLFLMANLHVTTEKSGQGSYINNPAIDRLNEEISQIARKKSAFYLDANSIFDGAQGGLDSDKTSDHVHLYAKYYPDWANWIGIQTAEKEK